MPPPVFSKPMREPEIASERVFKEAVAAVKRNFPEWSAMPIEHVALQDYTNSTDAIRDAWPLAPRAALHALGFSLRDVLRILEYSNDGGTHDDDAKGKEEAIQTRRLVALLARLTEDDFPAALRWVWEARARWWEWTGGLAVLARKKRMNVDGKMGEEDKKETGEETRGEEGEEEAKEAAGEKTRVRRRMKPNLTPKYCTPDNIKIAIILARRDRRKREKDQEEKEAREDEEWPEEEQQEKKEAAYLALQDAMGDLEGSEDDDGSLLGELLVTGANFASCCGDRKKGRDPPTKQQQTSEEDAGPSVSEEKVKDRKDSKTQVEGSSTDATRPPSAEEATAHEDEGATMEDIMAAAQDLGDPSLTEDGPSSLTFDVMRFTDQLLESMALTRRDPPLRLDRRSKRFLPTAAQDLMRTPAKLHHHFYHTRSDGQLMAEMSSNYARREVLWQEYVAGCAAALKSPLSKKAWARSKGISLEEALFGDVVDGVLRPDCYWDEVRDCMQCVAESWRGVWESHLRRAWGEFAMARAEDVFERTDRA